MASTVMNMEMATQPGGKSSGDTPMRLIAMPSSQNASAAAPVVHSKQRRAVTCAWSRSRKKKLLNNEVGSLSRYGHTLIYGHFSNSCCKNFEI
ncbi:hypothetical protein BCCR75721_00803 [Burkholderia sola]|nr:hypothetical protein BCCR75389_00796 [Burkholderia cenocepacia]CAG2263205.1 hypothetical protein BCCR75386_00808 [Burkholderia cenocepacia]CAG2263311.1 hypothetical protein BCCR75388_00809 [Burkholderia cenocepacia]CAG2263394.1 hypothetical protein BCCR75384_00809 [Burkholderia cenocepacia]CAG2263398.1 hypothetical protein BCCR75387_00809 [Burkholderia cenocepacia]